MRTVVILQVHVELVGVQPAAQLAQGRARILMTWAVSKRHRQSAPCSSKAGLPHPPFLLLLW